MARTKQTAKPHSMGPPAPCNSPSEELFNSMGSQTKPVAHVIFCVDDSGSMKTLDATAEGGHTLSRAEAVARCCRQLVQQQLNEKGVLYSHIRFSSAAKATFVQVPVHTAATLLQSTASPRDGTNFASAWGLVLQIVEATAPDLLVHVVFLSDGRPGELPKNPPALGTEKPTSRSHGAEMASAPAVVRQLARRGSKLIVHALAIGQESPVWLERLVAIANEGGATATFLKPAEMRLELTEHTASVAAHRVAAQ